MAKSFRYSECGANWSTTKAIQARVSLAASILVAVAAFAETRIMGAGGSLYCDGGILLTADSAAARATLAALPTSGLTVEFWVRSNGWNHFPVVGLVPERPAAAMMNPYGLLWAPTPHSAFLHSIFLLLA